MLTKIIWADCPTKTVEILNKIYNTMNTGKANKKNGNLPIFSVRQRALNWWKELGDDIGEMADKYNKGCETIQEYQIEEIYLKEVGHVA